MIVEAECLETADPTVRLASERSTLTEQLLGELDRPTRCEQVAAVESLVLGGLVAASVIAVWL